MYSVFYEMNEPHAHPEIGVSLWGPGQALATAYKPTSCSSVNTSVSVHVTLSQSAHYTMNPYAFCNYKS